MGDCVAGLAHDEHAEGGDALGEVLQMELTELPVLGFGFLLHNYKYESDL